jgi:hypothetical protein
VRVRDPICVLAVIAAALAGTPPAGVRAALQFGLLRSLPKADVALLPFWYVLDDASRRFVGGAIGPRRIVGIHLPPADAAD